MDFLFALWVYMGLEAYTTGHWGGLCSTHMVPGIHLKGSSDGFVVVVVAVVHTALSTSCLCFFICLNPFLC